MFSEKELKLEETDLREQANLLSEAQREYYQRQERSALKHANTYAALNVLFFLGAHHFYLKRWLRGLINLILGLGALLLLLDAQWLYGAAILLALAIIEIPQLLNYEHLVHAHNNKMMRQCLRNARKSAR